MLASEEILTPKSTNLSNVKQERSLLVGEGLSNFRKSRMWRSGENRSQKRSLFPEWLGIGRVGRRFALSVFKAQGPRREREKSS